MAKLKIAACGVPVLLTAAGVPAASVVVNPTDTVAAVPDGPIMANSGVQVTGSVFL
jgi:hypothetical protein